MTMVERVMIPTDRVDQVVRVDPTAANLGGRVCPATVTTAGLIGVDAVEPALVAASAVAATWVA
jgi:hypothetical protein